ncbi:MAG: periplasmic heavy metal sensor [Bacteroidota bacterium]
MDWFNQLRMKNILIFLLVLMNIITVSVLWIQTSVREPGGKKERDPQSSGSVELMRTTLGFTEAQTESYRQLLWEYHVQSRPVNDRISELKKKLSETVFSGTTDTAYVPQLTKEIGTLQEQIELLRYRHFVKVTALCDQKQKEILQPIIAQLFGRKPPKEELTNPKQNRDEPRGQREPRGPKREQREESRRSSGDRTPPSASEKIDKYAQRLDLSPEQRKKLEIIITASQQRGEKLRGSKGADRQAVDSEKERIRKDEDDRIMDILSPSQKNEFKKMIEKRKR